MITSQVPIVSLQTYYKNPAKTYIIHTCREEWQAGHTDHRSSSILRRLFLSFLKCEGVRPVTFLNCVDRCATLL